MKTVTFDLDEPQMMAAKLRHIADGYSEHLTMYERECIGIVARGIEASVNADVAVREAKAAAWDEGFTDGRDMSQIVSPANPYRVGGAS